jgi:hypothetical protein
MAGWLEDWEIHPTFHPSILPTIQPSSHPAIQPSKRLLGLFTNHGQEVEINPLVEVGIGI